MNITLKDYLAITQLSRVYSNEDGYGGFIITKNGITERFEDYEAVDLLKKYGNDVILSINISIESSAFGSSSLGVYISLD